MKAWVSSFWLEYIITGYLEGKHRGAVFGYNVSLQDMREESMGVHFLVVMFNYRLFRRNS